jgi:hypothetical protein
MLSGAAPWVLALLARTLVTTYQLEATKKLLEFASKYLPDGSVRIPEAFCGIYHTPSNLPTIDFLTEVLQILFVCPYMWIAPLLPRC